jgi:alginate O-acetyltransferase complex protein AlgI
MLFSSAIFVFLFLPLVIAGYYLLRGNSRNYFLLLSSLIFFAWGGVSYSALLLVSILINYIFGRLIGNRPGSGRSSVYLGFGIGVNVLMLGIFKYANFLTGNLNTILEFAALPEIRNNSIALPIGISFYTFQAISYLVDVYRKDAGAQKNIFYLGLYISFFPQLIAGPIVRFRDIASQIISRTCSFGNFSYGIQRFLIGLAKKVLIANHFALIADEIFAMSPPELSVQSAWLGLIAYAFQIYFDFSGYSDMAIGLASLFGFKIQENFNFPYIAASVREFWRRWHISLSTWFRDYLYLPLGGNRKGSLRTYLNLGIVFFLTGLWHGASWNFVLWGLMHGFFMVAERVGGEKVLARTWKPVRHVYTIFVVLMAWVLFRTDNTGDALQYYKALFGLQHHFQGGYEYTRYFTPEFFIILIIAVLGSTTLLHKTGDFIERVSSCISRSIFAASWATGALVQLIFFACLMILCSMNLLTEAYNPFIYYRF